jgi:hypothetical protein
MVELMTHPIVHSEAEYLMVDEFRELLEHVDVGGMRWFDFSPRSTAFADLVGRLHLMTGRK